VLSWHPPPFCEGGSNPQREYSLDNLCEDSVAQSGHEIGLLQSGQVEPGRLLSGLLLWCGPGGGKRRSGMTFQNKYGAIC
jgi:hypothetical protein